jgi:GDP-L-fucose synthase
MSWLSSSSILVTGGSGFLGSHVLEQLAAVGATVRPVGPSSSAAGEPAAWYARSNQYDLSREVDVAALLDTVRPEVVIHLAAVCGGIGINREQPGTFYYKNLMMGALLMEHARIRGVKKFVAIGTICAYPKFARVPFREDDLWEGYPEETNAPYGIAKKAMLVQAHAYRAQFGFNAVYLLPVNLYGPRDNFNPRSSHVIPALIKKCIDARESGLDSIEVWGTGRATREFLYVDDAARGIVLATERYNDPEPINLGAGFEISIRDLVDLIVELTGYEGRIDWNSSYPDGQPRRSLECSRAYSSFGFEARVGFRDGLRRTIDWYEQQRVRPYAGVGH